MGCGNSSTNEIPNIIISQSPGKEIQNENLTEKRNKLMEEINFLKYEKINPNHPQAYYNILYEDFKSIEELENFLTKKKEEEKDQQSNIYYLFLLYCWLSQHFKIKSERKGELNCESLEIIMSKKSTNSFGLATVFKTVGEKLGFKIEIIQGFTKHFGFELEDFPKQYETNHSYNALILEDLNLILFCDVWLSLKDVEDYDTPKTINRYYFCVPQDEIINFNFPLEEKWQEKDNIITFDKFRNQIRLYSNFFKLHLEKIDIFEKNELEVEINYSVPARWNLYFKDKINNRISLKLYQFADKFRRIHDPYDEEPEGNLNTFVLKKKKRGLFKFELHKYEVNVADGFIRDVSPYKLPELRMGQRMFTTDELRKYPVCLNPFLLGDLIKGLVPSLSVVALDDTVTYRVMLSEPNQKVAAIVKCGDYNAELFGSYEYYEQKEYFLTIKFHHFGFYNCTIWIADKPQIFFNILYADKNQINKKDDNEYEEFY